MTALVVPGVGVSAVPADLVRLAALASVGLGTWWAGSLGFALFMLVLGGTMLPRALGSPQLLDWAFCLAILFGAWAAQLDWYATVPYLDVAVHAVANGLVATIGYRVLAHLGLLPAATSWAGVVVVVSSLGGTLALVWELGEWYGHTFVDERIQIGYDDTIGDLAMGLVGSVAAAVLLGRQAVRGLAE